MKAANDAVRFVVEVAVLIAVGCWGFHEHSSWLAKLALGAGAPVLIAVVWGLWMAPQSSRRAGEGTRVVLEVLIFDAATAALAASTSAIVAIIFAAVAAITPSSITPSLSDPTRASSRSSGAREAAESFNRTQARSTIGSHGGRADARLDAAGNLGREAKEPHMPRRRRRRLRFALGRALAFSGYGRTSCRRHLIGLPAACALDSARSGR